MTKKNYHHGNLGSQIIEEALALIESKGAQWVSLRKIAQNCEVSPTAIYRHFKNKEALLAKIAEDGFKRLKEIDKVMQPSKVFGVGYVEFALDNPGYFEVMFGTYIKDHRDYPDLEKAADSSYKELTDAIAEQLKGIQTSEELSLTAQKTWAMIHGLAVLMKNHFIEYTKKNRRVVIESILSAQVLINEDSH